MAQQEELVFLPLGGSGEIGMNLNLYGIGPRHARKWIIIDCGVMFSDLKTPGIDVICPDIDYLLDDLEEGGELLGLVLTHGHEDHVGAIAHLWPFLKCPVYATPFTAELANRKLAEAGVIVPEMNTIPMGSSVKLGPFDLELVTLTHSIPEPNGVIIRTEFGNILHTGDWKIDPEPTLGEVTNQNVLKKLGDQGVLAMVCDSTNVLSKGMSGSETTVARELEAVIKKQKGRVALTTFASNVGRLVSVINAAHAADRAVCLLGRSMLRMVDIAREVEILPDHISFVEPHEAGYLPDDKILYLCTGSQGEPRAALARIARDDHPEISLKEGDTVIFSSKVIPGNEREIYDMQNQLVDQGVKIITEKDENIHVSGHPCRDELQMMYEWVRPKHAIAVHGEARHLEEHAIFAREMGCKSSISPRNGDLITLAPGKPAIIDEVPSGRVLIDGKVFTLEGDRAIKDRRKLAFGGVVCVAVAIDKKNKLISLPEVSFIGIPEEDNQGEDIQTLLEDAVEEAIDTLPKPRRSADEEVKRCVKKAVNGCLFYHWGKRTQVNTLIIRG